MAREIGVYRRPDSRYWWISTTLPNGKRLRQSAGTEDRESAEALLAKLTLEAYREQHFGFKPERSWQEAIVRYLEAKATLKSYRDVQRICRNLHPYLGNLMLNHINGDVVWSIIQGEMKKGNKPATINRYLSLVRNLLRTARDEWQWIDSIPKVRLLPGEVERDRWLTRDEADRLIAVCPPHLKKRGCMTSVFTFCVILGLPGIASLEPVVMNSKSSADGKRGLWWIVMPSLQRIIWQ